LRWISFLTDELLDEVLTDPNNDDPRRVYADWLAERGDPRGEFIAVQCELARKFDFQLAIREQQLRRAHGAQWTAALGLASCRQPQIKFHRGFVERLELDVGDVAQIDVARTPLRSIIVRGVHNANVRKLATVPAIPTLDTLGLRDAHLNAKAQRSLADIELVTTTPGLAFLGGQMGDVSELAAVAFPALRSLHLDGVRIRDLEVLARAAWLPQLRSFRIRDDHKFGIDHLLRACLLPALTELVIESTVLESTFVVLGNLPELESLELSLDRSDAFVRARGFEKLKRFAVRGGVEEALRAVLRERWGDRLVVLNR
jgi:uncharacterized protein (TIGR02996 family)